jgi:hypothetical protein
MTTTAPVKAAARERATRTLLTGLGLDLLVAVAVVLGAWLPDADLSNRAAWGILGGTVAKSVLSALVSYVLRLKVRPSEETATGR